MRLIVVSPYRIVWENGYSWLESTIRFSGYDIAYRPRVFYSAPDVTSVQLQEEAQAKFDADQVDYQPNMLLPLADEGFESPPDPYPLHTDAAPDETGWFLTVKGREALNVDDSELLDWNGGDLYDG